MTLSRWAALALCGILWGAAAPRVAVAVRQTASARQARVVSVVPAITEMLYAMGAADTVAGVSNYDRFPDDVLRKPRVGALLDPNLEAMLALRPTLAVVHASQVDLQRQLSRSGIALMLYRHTGLAGIPGHAREIGERIGRPEAGRELAARIEGTVAAASRAYADRPRPRTLLVIGREPGSLRNVLASGGIGFLHDMLVAAGAHNLLADVTRENVPMSVELLIARDPDVIIEIDGGATSQPTRALEQDWQQLPPRAAGPPRRIVVVRDPALVIPGPRVAEAIGRLGRAVHGVQP